MENKAIAADWTIVWFAFEDNLLLEDLVVSDVSNIAIMSQAAGVNLHALIDTHNLGSWRVTRAAAAPMLTFYSIPNQNMNDPRTLTGLLQSAFRASPAQRYGLVLSGHGAAYQISAEDGEHMDVDLIAKAVRCALDEAHVDKLDFVSWDTCMMSSASMAAVSSTFARHATACETYCDDNGAIVRGMLSLFNDTTSTLNSLLALQERYLNECPAKAECDMSILKLDNTAVASLLDAARLMQRSFTLSTYRAASLQHAGIMVDPAWPHLADMQSLAELMHRRGELSAPGLKYVIAAVAAVVVKTVSSPARLGVVTHCGLSISVCPNADTTGYDVPQAWYKFSNSVLVLNETDTDARCGGGC